MPLVGLNGVSVSYGDRNLLEGVNITMSAGARTALVGPNGSGKSTLMRIMAGLVPPDSGSVVREKDTRVSYVPQAGVVHAGASLEAEAEKAFAWGHAVVAEIRDLEEQLGALTPGSSSSDALLARYHDLTETLDADGYWGRAEEIFRVLSGLGFSREDFGRDAAEFSAGWQMRIALAKAILEKPDILLLDEPTNYLDIEARTWLEEFLARYPGGLLIVSHDRYFLDVTVRAVAEIYMARVSVFSGNYTHYEEVRALELEAIAERYRLQQVEIARTEAFIRRFRYNASKARLVQSRVTWLEKLPRIQVPPVVKAIRFSFPPPPLSGRVVLAAESLGKSYGDRRVFEALALEVGRGDKLAVVGQNGAGKSTLLRIVSSREEPDSGTLHWGTGVISASYSQESADAWTTARQVLEEVEAAAPTPLVPELRNLLGAFLFRGDDVFKPVSVLSGGEKSRLALLLLLMKPANLLILDEPTNHLDLASKDVLLAALKGFPGAVIFVSHDRHFLDHLATGVLELRAGRSRYFPGGYEYYQRRLSQEVAGAAALQPAVRAAAGGLSGLNGATAASSGGARRQAAEEAPSAASQSALDRQVEKSLKSSLRSLEREEAGLLARLEERENEGRRLEEEMARPDSYQDGERMRDLTRSLAACRAEHDSLMEKWEDLSRGIAEAKEKLKGLRSGKDPQ